MTQGQKDLQAHAECQAQMPAAFALLAAAHAKPVDPAGMCAWCTATVVIVPDATTTLSSRVPALGS